MSEDYGSDFITVTDDEGAEFELEHISTLSHNNETYMSFLPADMDEDDEDFGMVILKVVETDGEEVFVSVDDENELQTVYEKFMELLFEDEDE